MTTTESRTQSHRREIGVGSSPMSIEDRDEMRMRAKEAAHIRYAFDTGKAQRRRRRMIARRRRVQEREEAMKHMIRDSMKQTRYTTPWVSIPRCMDEKMNVGRQAASAGKITAIIRRSRDMTEDLDRPRSLEKFQEFHRIAKHASMLTKMNKKSAVYKQLTMSWKSPPHHVRPSPISVLDIPPSSSDEEDWMCDVPSTWVSLKHVDRPRPPVGTSRNGAGRKRRLIVRVSCDDDGNGETQEMVPELRFEKCAVMVPNITREKGTSGLSAALR